MHIRCVFGSLSFFSLFLWNVYALGMIARIMQEKCTPLSNASLCLSLFSWCGTAVHLCTCSDRTTASLSSLQILTATASQIRTPLHSESKSLTWNNWGLFGMLTPIDVVVFKSLMLWFILLLFHLSQDWWASHKHFYAHCLMQIKLSRCIITAVRSTKPYICWYIPGCHIVFRECEI